MSYFTFRFSQGISLAFALLLFWTSCKPDEEIPDVRVVSHDETPYLMEYGDLPEPTLPDDNPMTVQGVRLGRMLFYEPQMSINGQISCSSCHLQENAFSDPRQFSLGTDGLPGSRHAMSVFNMAWNDNGFFWDGRAPHLRDQALLPIQDPLEMNETLDRVVSRLDRINIYKDQFARTFGDDKITARRISLALEQFMFSIVSHETKYDRFLRNEATLSSEEERGRELFFAEYNPFFPAVSGADCQHCHSGKNFSNNDYINNGLDEEADFTDMGYYDVTENTDDRAKFKVPSLRNIELTAPYMHDGRFATLEEVVEHYDNGIHASPTLDVTLDNTRYTGLMLTPQDKADLVAFLKTLTDESLTTNPAYSSPF